MKRSSLGLVLAGCAAGLIWLSAAPLLRPAVHPGGSSATSPTLVHRVAEALPHTHGRQKTGETTGTIGYIDATNKIIIAQLKDGAIIKALTSVPTEHLRVGERVKVAYGVGEHGEQVFTVEGPTRWFAFFGG